MKQYFTEQGETYDEAYRKARQKYGDGVTVLFRKTVMIRRGLFGFFSPKEGVEISGLISPNIRTETSLSQTGYPAPGLSETARKSPPKEPLDFEKEKIKVLAAAGQKEPTLQMVLNEVRTLKDKITEQGLAPGYEEHPSLDRIEELLSRNDFSPSYRGGILDRVKKEFPLDSLNDFDLVQDKVLEWIGKSIPVFPGSRFHHRPRIMVLVGPTGVGKTTTIAKLAANFGIDQNGRRIREIVLITIDTFRIGARQQLEAYGKILQAPCFAIEDYEELKKTIALNSDGADIILIDTIGKSPRDMARLGEMKQILDACGSQAEVHLAVSAATKSSDIEEILQQFEPFNYQSVIITKLDETSRVGNIISVLSEKQKPVSYITNGQKVPADIKMASVINFLISLDGFKVNRIKLEESFPDTDSKQFR